MSIELERSLSAFLETAEKSLPESSESGLTHLCSTPMLLLGAASIKNITYLIENEGFKSHFSNFFTSREDYFEVACLSAVSFIHNFVMGLFYTGFVVLTLGQSENLNFASRKHWAHVFDAFTALGVGGAGFFSPSFASRVNRKLEQRFCQTLRRNYQNDLKLFESQLVSGIKNYFQEYKNLIIKSAIEWHPDLFHSEQDLFFTELITKIEQAQYVGDFLEAAFFTWKKITSANKKNSMTFSFNENIAVSRRDLFRLYQLFSAIDALLWKKLPNSTKNALILLQSAPLLYLSSAFMKNLSYAAAADKFRVNIFSHMLSSRVNYIEVVLLGIVSTIYHYGMAILYATASLLTLRYSEMLNFSCKKHWSHLSHSLVSSLIGLVGICSPLGGVILNVYLLNGFKNSFEMSYQQDLEIYHDQVLSDLKTIYKNHRDILEKIGREWFDTYLKIDFDPFLKYLEKKIFSSEKMDDILHLLKDLWIKFPRAHLVNKEDITPEDSPAMWRQYKKKNRSGNV